MPPLNFKKQFRPHIESRRKKHTIRAKRKRPIKVGDKLYLYTGMRTECVKVEEIAIKLAAGGVPVIYVEGHPLAHDESEALAYADGFDSFADMMKFWDGRLPFTGDIIHWREGSRR
jgi:hypothetical protein